MKRTDKIKNIQKLKTYLDRINTKRIDSEELQFVKQEYQKLNKIELPILLFVIDEFLVNEYVEVLGQEEYYRYKYVYYYPDINRVDTFYSQNAEELMEGAVNLKSLGDPFYQEYLKGNINFLKMVELATTITNEKIDYLLSLYNIENWDELKKYLEISLENSEEYNNLDSQNYSR